MSAAIATTVIENMSLYIPHVFPNFTKEDIAKAFEDNCIGKVKNIDFVAKLTSKEGVSKLFNAAYIHFDEWYDNIVARNFHSRVRDPTKEARLMYEDPWYWVVLENKARKYLPGERKPCIVLDSTPVKVSLPYTWAPVKSLVQKKSVAIPVSVAVKLDSEFAASNDSIDEDELEWMDALIDEEEKQMDEIEEAIKEEDKYLVSIDSRYVRTLEEKNNFANELEEQSICIQERYKKKADYFYTEYCKTMELYKTETIKTQALMEAFQMMTKEKQT